MSVSVRDFEMKTVSHQRVMAAPTNITGEIYDTVCVLFDELWDGMPIRHLGVHTSRVSKQERGRQMSLFDLNTNYEKM